MFQKRFTPQEANKRLPLIRKIVLDILEIGKTFKKIIETSPAGTDIPQEALLLKEEMQELMIELEDLGCFFKDWNFEIGLVDFPSLIEGREVLLCWRSDEPEIRWYHGIDEGFTGRKPIPEHLLNLTGSSAVPTSPEF